MLRPLPLLFVLLAGCSAQAGTFYSGGAFNQIGGGGGGAASLSWVTLDPSDSGTWTEADPNSIVGTVSHAAGVTSFPYQNASGGVRDGTEEGWSARATITDVLPDYSLTSGDQIMVRITAQSGTTDWDDISIGVGYYCAASAAGAAGLGGNGAAYFASRASAASDATGSNASISLSGGDIVYQGVVGFSATSGNTTPMYAAGAIVDQTVGNGISADGFACSDKSTSAVELLVSLWTLNNTDNGAKTAQAAIEVARVPYPL